MSYELRVFIGKLGTENCIRENYETFHNFRTLATVEVLSTSVTIFENMGTNGNRYPRVCLYMGTDSRIIVDRYDVPLVAIPAVVFANLIATHSTGSQFDGNRWGWVRALLGEMLSNDNDSPYMQQFRQNLVIVLYGH